MCLNKWTGESKCLFRKQIVAFLNGLRRHTQARAIRSITFKAMPAARQQDLAAASWEYSEINFAMSVLPGLGEPGFVGAFFGIDVRFVVCFNTNEQNHRSGRC
jgi:hypothetical protein